MPADDAVPPSEQIAAVRREIEIIENYRDSSILIRHRLVCDLPVQGALHRLRQRLASLEAATPDDAMREGG